jgi:hypothetical protein
MMATSRIFFWLLVRKITLTFFQLHLILSTNINLDKLFLCLLNLRIFQELLLLYELLFIDNYKVIIYYLLLRYITLCVTLVNHFYSNVRLTDLPFYEFELLVRGSDIILDWMDLPVWLDLILFLLDNLVLMIEL